MSKKTIDKQDVIKTGSLAKLNLTESEVEKFGDQLAGVLENFSSVDKVDTKGVEITAQVTGLEDVMAEDVSKRKIKVSRKDLLKNSPISEDGYIIVPKVL
jgi:aspartyl/glutamyl-tRNA(Asn/Gln) amidotransferase C subunit